MNKEIKWYAVHTRPRWEKKVAGILHKKGIEFYCPLNKILRQWADRKKFVFEPLFTGYVFIRSTEEEHLKVKQTAGVINIVYWLGKPAVVKDAEIDAIKKFLDNYNNVQVQKTQININDKVRIIHGPLIYLEGHVMNIMKHSIKILLPSLGFAMIAQLEYSSVEKMPN